MKILSAVDSQLEFIGLRYDEHSKHLLYRLYSYIWILAVASVLIPEYIYFQVHLEDIDKASDAVIFISATAMTVIKIFQYHHFKAQYAAVISKIRNNVNKKVEEGRLKYYVEQSQYCEKITKLYYNILTTAMIFGLGLPLLVVIFNYLRGTLTKDVWYLPFPGKYFYDADSSPGFELTYVWHTIALIGIIRSYGAIDSLFMTMCIHIGAGYMDLRNMILEIDVEDLARSTKHSETHSSVNMENDPNGITSKHFSELQIRTSKCVDFYSLMDECYHEVETVNSGIVFTQFCGTILIMCTSVFQMTSTYESGKVVSYINFVICYMSQLFVYAYYGHHTNTERLKIADTAYDGWWYLRPKRLRPFYQFTMMKAQKPKFVRGFGYLDCSLVSFGAVIKASGTAFTLLQTAKEKF